MPFGGANNTLLQIAEYNLLGQLIGAVLGPYAQAITNEVQSITPLIPLSPADLALAVIRNELTEETAAGQAAMSGVNAERFHTLARLTGDAPGPGDLAVALRRKLIDAATYDRGIRQGRLRDEWADLVRELAVQQPSPEAILTAYLEGQVDEGEARDRWSQLGGDPAYFDIMYHTQGQAPSPVEALDLANRGVIPWEGVGPESVSFEQSFLEGPWRNKWLKPFRALGEYLPPPRTVVAMYREGSLDHPRAAGLLAKQGLAPDLVEAYLASGSSQKTEDTKKLAQSTVVDLYRDRLVKPADATAMLVSLGYSAEEAGFILSIEDMRVGQQYLSLAVGRIRSLYTGHKISKATASSVLGRLGLEAQGMADLLGIWDWERAANVRALTPADIAAAYVAQIITQDAATAELTGLGYLPHDAWLYLSVHAKQKLPGEPPADAVGPAPGA